jgi:lipoprotein NlpI
MVGYYKEAALIYERAVNMGYHTPEAYNNLGVVYHAQKNYERAVWAFERALELDADHVDARRNFELVSRKLEGK